MNIIAETYHDHHSSNLSYVASIHTNAWIILTHVMPKHDDKDMISLVSISGQTVKAKSTHHVTPKVNSKRIR